MLIKKNEQRSAPCSVTHKTPVLPSEREHSPRCDPPDLILLLSITKFTL